MTLKKILPRLLTNSHRNLEVQYLRAQFRRTVFEPTPTIGIIQIFSGFATLAAYTCTDQLQFRTLFAFGTLTGTLIPNFYRKPMLVLPFVWGVTFLSVNLTRIGQLLMERKPVSFDDREMFVYESTFYKFLTPNQFMKIVEIGEWTEYDAEAIIKVEGDNDLHLNLILEGAVVLTSVGKDVGVIDTHDGVYKLTGIPRDTTQPNSDTDNKMVTVTVKGHAKTLRVPHDKLSELLAKDPGMTSGLLRLFHERLLQVRSETRSD